MYTYYNPNPKQKRVGDCVIRAICKALDMDWEDAYIQLCMQGFKMADMPSSNATWGAYLMSKGFIRKPIPNSCPECFNIRQFSQQYSDGIYIVGTGTHAVAIAFGNYFDSWDSGEEVIQYAWELVK